VHGVAAVPLYIPIMHTAFMCLQIIMGGVDNLISKLRDCYVVAQIRTYTATTILTYAVLKINYFELCSPLVLVTVSLCLANFFKKLRNDVYICSFIHVHELSDSSVDQRAVYVMISRRTM